MTASFEHRSESRRTHAAPLRDRGVQLYYTDLDCGIEDADLMLLNENERARSARFVFARDRLRYVVGRMFLRRVLSAILNEPPSRIAFSYSLTGKPSLADHAGIQFNLSHSDHWAVLAVAEAEIGVDVEQIKLLPDLEAVAHAYFSPSEERAVLSSGDVLERLSRFYTCWTRKEAYLKAIGMGICAPLKDFEVAVVPEEPVRIKRIAIDGEAGPEQWTLLSPRFIPDAVVAIAVRDPEATLDFISRYVAATDVLADNKVGSP